MAKVTADIGDRVRFRTEGLPDREHHVGWALDNTLVAEGGLPVDVQLGTDPPLAPVTVSWNEHFGGLLGVVVNLDENLHEVSVRGVDRSGHEFLVWIDCDHVEVVQKALDLAHLAHLQLEPTRGT